MTDKTVKIRQGDVLLVEISKLPVRAKELKDKVLAYGEQTGHTHRFEEPKNVMRYADSGRTYLQVFSPTPLIHEEHNTLIIDRGIYEQIQEREYDYVEESMKKVVD